MPGIDDATPRETPLGYPKAPILDLSRLRPLPDNQWFEVASAANHNCQPTNAKVLLFPRRLAQLWRSEISNAILGRGIVEENLVGGPVTEARAGAIV